MAPIAGGEIPRSADGFVDALYADGANFEAYNAESRDGYRAVIIRGGFPEGARRGHPARARALPWITMVADIINLGRDAVSEIERPRHGP